ncbi:MAG: DEAD/DEAH box helicase family protein [Bacteroidales bacterium]|nr:DEAD/DEAH box helicase family protein [Candidatus Sodaliphilus limicaballi]
MSTKFFTNREGNTLMKKFEGVLSSNTNIKHLDAVVGFLRASGYFSLRPFLDNINKARILVGIDVDKYIIKAHNAGKMFFGAESEVKEDYLIQLKKDIESANYTKEVESGIKQMVDDLTSGKLELRAHPSKKVHAKMYILYPDNFNSNTLDAAAITGSSNLSGNGLGITQDKQYEFNVMLRDNDDVQFAKDEFEQLWAEAEGCPIEATDVDAVITGTYLNGDATPYEVYIKMLMEYFSDRVLATDSQNAFDMPEGYTSYEYQTDAVIEGYQKLLKYDGFFLADVVGLGKTVIATMIAKQFCIDNGYENTKILVVYPPAVENNWKQTFKDFGIDKYTRFISNGSLKKVLDEDNYDYWNADEYDLVLVDEAHKFRTHTNTAFTELQEICKMPRVETGNIPGFKKKVMLISATPMNNTPADLYNEILLFQDPRCCTIDGVPNLTSFFSPLVVEFKKLKRDPEYDLSKFKELATKVRDRIIKPITVRRTRTDIESIPRYHKDIQGFPKVAPPVQKTYEMNDRIANMFEDAMSKLVNNLCYARYQAIAYLLPEKAAGLYDNAELISRSLASIRKNGLVKRLESSFYAFQTSIRRFRDANQYMINMFENDRVFIAPDLDINYLYDQGLTDDEIEERLNNKAEDNPKNAVFKAADFEPVFIKMLRDDQAVLEAMCKDWDTVTEEDDSKFAKFKDILKHELFKKDRNPGQKLVIFSESVDTVEYLKKRIGRNDVLVIDAGNRNKKYKDIQENFDANYKKELQKDDYNIIITTDVLAEGVNLHRSNIIINYDTPWNSTKLMQRIGRVNRIGSVGKDIYNYVFYPSRQGNRIIKLNQIALSKIQTFHTTFGEDNKIYSKEEIIDRDLEKLFNDGMQSAARERNEEVPFYEELRSLYLNDRREYNRISKMSLRSRTGRKELCVDNVTLSEDTLVFLKTNMRKTFFRASDESVEELSVVEALKFFKAEPTEQGVKRIEHHHEHVVKAIEKFNQLRGQEVVEVETNAMQSSSSLGAQVAIASSLLNLFLPEIQDENLYQKVVQLRLLAERGVITIIAKRLQRMSKDLQRGKLHHDQALNEIIEMANKYNAYFLSSEDLKHETETEPSIILSESFE